MARSATPRASRTPKAPEAAPAPASDAVLEAAPSPLDHDRDGELGGSLPDGFRWSEEAEHGEGHAPFILSPTGARVADTAEALRAQLDAGLADLTAPVLSDAGEPVNPPKGDLAADLAEAAEGAEDATAGRTGSLPEGESILETGDQSAYRDAISRFFAEGAAMGGELTLLPDFGDAEYVRPAFVGQTVLFREHQRRFKGAPTTPAIITWVYDDLVVDLTVLPRGDVPYPREAVPYEQTLEEDGLGRAWSFINL